MTGDLISRKALVKALIAERDKHPPEVEERYSFGVKLPHRYNQAIRGGIRKALREIEMAPAVDAVPVVRCKDCVFWMDRHVLLPDGTRRPYAPGEESVTADVGINCGARCMRAAEYLNGNGPFCEAGDFCSRGERKDDKEA